MSSRAPLSSYETSQQWLRQFLAADAVDAAALLDAMLLLNEEQVSAAIRSQLYALADGRSGRRRRVALYAEREMGQSAFFQSTVTLDAKGRRHYRAVGRAGPPAVKPLRGGMRVGSEGLVGFVISQAKEARPTIFMNQPGPDLLRGKTAPAGTMALVTDFIGSGSRVRSMLDALWAVPTVRAWRSRGWVDFCVVAAAGTEAGITSVQRHRLRPDVRVEHVAPTIVKAGDWRQADRWFSLINRYGPDTGRGASRWGFGKTAALVAFNYRLPNNTPALLHQSTSTWRALYDGPAPDDLRPAFGLRRMSDVITSAAVSMGVRITPGLAEPDAATVLVLSAMRGRWWRGKEIALSERTGMTTPDVMEIVLRALRAKLITNRGRLTDAGHQMLEAARRLERKRPSIATSTVPYYPSELRTPRASSSTRRPYGRP
ncbi:phosphoribosyltransferase-like protein [Xanthobacter versatilis]|uniref:phosphoribosyltransferase-like protein n=1 Tax=Xanthobacter autotrophicus (strain ATCC BAA-1158 / Py2) TaxID=78245 RepID=UPI0037281A1B